MDDTAAVVQRRDVRESWLREVEQFCSMHGLSGAALGTQKDYYNKTGSDLVAGIEAGLRQL